MALSPTVAAVELAAFAASIFRAVGMADADARHVAHVLVWSNLRGNDGHGVQRIPRYMELVDEGTLNPRPTMTQRLETAAAVLIDADRAPGPLSMTFAADEAVRKAGEAGIGLALVRRTTHTAAIGFYTRRVAEAGMAAIAATASILNMPYHGARVPSVSTSPLSMAVPGGGRAPIVLDMATSVVSLGRLAQLRRTGKNLMPGWALDAAGNETTDAAKAELPLPLGGPKGAGLALMAECMASILTGNPILAPALTEGGEAALHRQNSFIIAIDIARFGDIATFRDSVGRLVDVLKSLPRQMGFDEILMPGERGDRIAAARAHDGIPIPPATWTELSRVADRFHLAMPATL
ncbi:MAG TPA: Ldh family oxidoreductase [Stellaceae bacterium]|nr:Ldh family oxidoreductase [Stellaceae bacterium]